jgi:hypothetical protein
MLKIATALLEADANPNPRTASGNTPLRLVNTNTPECQKMAKLLREHGAVVDPPDFNSIRLSRSGKQPIVIWRHHTNDLNQFTLFETLANFYHSTWTFTPARIGISTPTMFPRESYLFSYPDLKRITITRPIKGHVAEKTELPVEAMKDAETFECASNQPLQFGDVIEIPEREHTITGPSVNLTTGQTASLHGCLTQTVTFKIKSKSIEIASPAYTFQNFLSESLKRDQVQALLTSRSDLSRVTVHRATHTTGETQNIIEDVQSFWNKQRDSSDDLWLRDGDIIEVPEK